MVLDEHLKLILIGLLYAIKTLKFCLNYLIGQLSRSPSTNTLTNYLSCSVMLRLNADWSTSSLEKSI